MTQTTTYHGSCLCGEIQFDIQGEPKAITRCHCWNCRKYTGGAFSPNVIFPAAVMNIVSGEENRRAYPDSATTSGNTIYRHFCKTCGSKLFNSLRADTGVAAPPSTAQGAEEDKLFAVMFYSALDYKIRRIEGEDGMVKEVKEKIEEPPTVEFHVRDRLSWVDPLEGAMQVWTAPGRLEDV